MDFVPPGVIMELNQQILQAEQEQQANEAITPTSIQVQVQGPLEDEQLSMVRHQTGMALKQVTRMIRHPTDVKIGDAAHLFWFCMILFCQWMVAIIPERV